MSANPFEAAIETEVEMNKTAAARDKKERARLRRAAEAEREHTIVIRAAGCETTRECYCLSTGGRSHTEWQSPWVVDVEGHYERQRGTANPRKEVLDPNREPFLPSEDFEDYEQRLRDIKLWDEAYGAGLADGELRSRGAIEDDELTKNPHRANQD